MDKKKIIECSKKWPIEVKSEQKTRKYISQFICKRAKLKTYTNPGDFTSFSAY